MSARLCLCCATLLGLVLAAGGCARTKAGTHVELVNQDGADVYVAGAAAPGMNQGQACTGAVGRAVGAIALKFAQEQDDLADEVAEAVGASDGEVFLQRFAKAEAERAAVQDVQFDPGAHLCMATVRWRPPVFLKDALLKFAQDMKAQETGTAPAGPAAEPAAAAASPAAPAAAGGGAAAAAPPPDPCRSEQGKLDKARDKADGARADLAECSRRTSGDETICHRYKLYVEEAEGKESAAAAALQRCRGN